jgi:hypothetical protein
MEIAAVDAVENVGKAERFLRSFFQAPCGNHQRESGRRPTLFDFHRCAIFNSVSRPRFFGMCGKEVLDTPSPLRINFSNRSDG